jgi:hypothetical protein
MRRGVTHTSKPPFSVHPRPLLQPPCGGLGDCPWAEATARAAARAATRKMSFIHSGLSLCKCDGMHFGGWNCVKRGRVPYTYAGVGRYDGARHASRREACAGRRWRCCAAAVGGPRMKRRSGGGRRCVCVCVGCLGSFVRINSSQAVQVEGGDLNGISVIRSNREGWASRSRL